METRTEPTQTARTPLHASIRTTEQVVTWRRYSQAYVWFACFAA
jgi:hypothetical protein